MMIVSDVSPGVSSSNLHELADHLGSQDASMLITQVDGARVVSEGGAGLDPHVELSCEQELE